MAFQNRIIACFLVCIFCLLFVSGEMSPANAQGSGDIIDIGSRRELFADRLLIDKLSGTRLKLHEPKQAGIAVHFDKPWEGAFCGYVTVIKDGDVYKMYYRGLPLAGADGSDNEVTCYAESRDGIRWEKPDLGLFEVHGTTNNNVILSNNAPFSHNFAPFLDTRPGVPRSERYKAAAGTHTTGIITFVSPDGIRWKKMREEPVITEGAFDSQNVMFWSEHENCYVCYFRTWTKGEFKGYRTVSRSTSKDFRTWSDPVEMDFGDTPVEHLYTSQTTPYFRAPHLYIAIPMRFMPGRKVLTDKQALALGVNPKYKSDCAEAVFMTSRGGSHYDRTFMEGFIRPGSDPGNWASRAGMTACGIVPTGPIEISLYKQAHYAQSSCHLIRYTLRTDGFVSVNAPYSGGEMITKPIKFSGNKLVLNYSTSAAGGIHVELQDVSGTAIPGFSLDDSDEIIGDAVERVVTWKDNSDVSSCAGKPVRLRFVMKDADIYSIRFK